MNNTLNQSKDDNVNNKKKILRLTGIIKVILVFV